MKKEKILKLRELNNFKDIIDGTANVYPDNIVFKYKLDPKQDKIEEVTYKKYQKDIKSMSTALLNLGLENERIAIIGNNRYEWCVSYLAVTTGNMIVIPLDKSLPENELISLIKRSEAKAIIFDKKYEETIKEIYKSFDSNLKYLICMDGSEDDNILSYDSLIEKAEKEIEEGNNKYDNISIDNKRMSIMLFTSGTTSEAKAVMLSQENICKNLEAYYSHFRLYPTDTLLSFLPIHHTFECSITFLYGVYCGVTIAFCDGLKYIQKNLQDYKVSVFVAVPLVMETMYKRIMKAVEDQGKDKLIKNVSKISNGLLKLHIDIRKKVFKQILEQLGGNLRVVLYGAAAMDKETIIGFTNFGIELIQGYGLTETSPVLSAESETKKCAGSVGYPLPNVEIEIRNKDANGEGEVWAKGPNIMLGYYNNEAKTKEVLVDGWFNTGDYGYYNKDGFLFITGRKNDIIVLRNGKNIYPDEIEKLINKIMFVDESLVYSRDRDKTDTVLCAKIVYNKELMKEQYPDKDENDYHNIIWEKVKEVNQCLPTYKHIKSITITSEPMIKTTTQKIKRYQEINKLKNN